jgi:hypothetical protein
MSDETVDYIGYLIPAVKTYAVVCTECRISTEGVPIFGVNIRPYKQRCYRCGVTLVESELVELFTGESD